MVYNSKGISLVYHVNYTCIYAQTCVQRDLLMEVDTRTRAVRVVSVSNSGTYVPRTVWRRVNECR